MSENAGLKKKMLHFAQNALKEIFSADTYVCKLAGGGSDRAFYRLRSCSNSYVIMHDPRPNHELQQYHEIGSFLSRQDLGAPHIFAADTQNNLLIMEDLGDDSLEAVLHRCVTRSEVLSWYRRAVAFLALMHSRASSNLHLCPAVGKRRFDYEAFRFETQYFRDSFLKGLCGINTDHMQQLEQEFHILAAQLARAPRYYFMHRDFQSKNIHIKNSVVRIIDFQTATQGPPQYDLASLLKDSYFFLEPEEQTLMVHYYIDTLNDLCENNFVDTNFFFMLFDYASLQRNMQALGAFSFLGRTKGKEEFLRYIPAGLCHLIHTLKRHHEFPALLDTVTKAASVLGHTSR